MTRTIGDLKVGDQFRTVCARTGEGATVETGWMSVVEQANPAAGETWALVLSVDPEPEDVMQIDPDMPVVEARFRMGESDMLRTVADRMEDLRRSVGRALDQVSRDEDYRKVSATLGATLSMVGNLQAALAAGTFDIETPWPEVVYYIERYLHSPQAIAVMRSLCGMMPVRFDLGTSPGQWAEVMDDGPVVRVRFLTTSVEDGVTSLVTVREEQHPGYITAAYGIAAYVGEMAEWVKEESA